VRARIMAASLLAMTVAGAGAVRADSPRALLPGRTYTWTFAADTLGRAPAFTRVAGGSWAVVEDSTQSGARLLRQLESDDGLGSHALQFLKPRVADQELAVRYRIRSGEIDPSVGIALHLDAKGRNGYLVRISGRSRELIVHYILNGKRRDIKMVGVEPPKADEWHTLGVRRVGERLEVLYDGVVKMKLRDERFSIGNIGLWTEDDTVADFSGLSVRTL
jgi:hypothetical protein